MGDLDPLFELKNLFLIGNYQAAINEGLSLDDLPQKLCVERDVFVYRSYTAKGDYSIVLEEIKDDTSEASLQAVRNVASYLSSEDNKEECLAYIKDWLSDPQLANDVTIQLLAAQIYYFEENYDEVMKTLHQSSSLEGRALLVQTYLQISRLDLAQKELESMKNIDDDATTTQLATASVNLFLGDERIEEAFYIFTELIEKWNATPLLLNGLASCHLHSLSKKDETKIAEQNLLQALEKNPNDADTIANLIVCYHHMNKPKEIINRYTNQLKARHPSHPWVKKQNMMEESFDRCCAQFSPSSSSSE